MKTHPAFWEELSYSDKRELATRLSALLAALLKLKYVDGQVLADNQRERSKTVQRRRRELMDMFTKYPGLKAEFTD